MKRMVRLAPRATGVLAVSALCLSGAVWARDGRDSNGGDDRAQRAMERAMRDTARAQERTDRDTARYVEDRARIMDRAAADPARAGEELARLDADRAKDAGKAVEDAAKDAADFRKDMQKAADDVARTADRAAEDSGDHGGSAEMRHLASDEAPDFDRRGFPVRRGEVVGLNLRPEVLADAQARGFRLVAREGLPALDGEVVRLAAPKGLAAEEALSRIRQIDPDAVVDYVHYYGLQYRPSGTANEGRGGSLPRRRDGLTIGMIDTGVTTHPSLKGVSIRARDFSAGAGAVPVDHGTAVASILVSEGSERLYVANIFRAASAGAPYTSADAVLKALEWMVANDVPVVNVSLAGPRNAVLDALIERTAAKGVSIVAAAGNGGPTAPPAYPAALRRVVAVTAVDRDMRVYRYANQGRYITVAARGVGEAAAQSGGGIGRFSGTSFATPHVAAWMARCMKAGSGDDCTARMRRTARDLGEPGHDAVYGYGYVQ